MPLIEYQVGVVGQRNVATALRGIEKDIAQHNARVARQFGVTPSAARRASAPGTARQKVSETARGFDQIGRAARAADLRAGRESIAQARRIEREKIASVKRSAKAEEQVRTKQARNEERAMVAHFRAVERERGKVRATTMGAIGRGAGNAIGGMASAAASIGGLGLAAGAGMSVMSEIEIQKRVRQTIINARGPGQQGAFTDQELRGKVRATAMGSSQKEGDVIGGLETFVARTGDLKTGVSIMQTLGTVAAATGANFEDVAATAADLMQKFDIKKTEDMSQAFAELVFQGKKGAFELKDMAAQFPEMAAAAQRAGMKGIGGMKTLGGLAQIARQSTGSGAEASTAVQMMLTQLVAESGNLKSGKALGGKSVNIFSGKDATTPLRNAPDVLADVISQSGGNLQMLQDIFDVRGIRAISPMVGRFREASAAAGGGAKGTEAGRQAVLAMIKDASESGAKFADVQKDATDATQTTAAALERLKIRFNEAMGSKLLPAFEKLLPTLEQLIDPVAKLATFFANLALTVAKNPWTAVSVAIAASIAKEIAAARVADIIRRAMMGGAGGSGIPVPGAGGLPVGGGVGAGGGTRGGFFGAPGSRLGTLGAAAGVAAMAVPAWMAAYEQAGQLTQETGVNVLPGMGSGKFDWGNLAMDATGGGLLARVAHGLLTEDDRKDSRARHRYQVGAAGRLAGKGIQRMKAPLVSKFEGKAGSVGAVEGLLGGAGVGPAPVPPATAEDIASGIAGKELKVRITNPQDLNRGPSPTSPRPS